MKRQSNQSMARDIKGNLGQPKMTKEEAKKLIEKQRQEDRRMVKGIFKFYECPTASLSFSFKKYKGDPVEHYTLIDGQVYEVPLGVAKHLNNSGWYPVHAYAKSEDGMSPTMRVGQKIHRYGFQSLDFVDIEEKFPSNDIVTVEKV